MCNPVDVEPTCLEEDTKKKEWMDVILKEYQSIINKYVWDVVPRPRENSVVSSKWIFKTKHWTYEIIANYKVIFVA